MSLLKHLSNVPSNRRAVAPYNFVELPDQVVPASLPLDHDRYYGDRLTGKIECTLTTASPLYIRCGLTSEQFQREQQTKDLPDFFYTNSVNQPPVIPGSSLRGMLRTLVEIISFSKFERLSNNQKFFFRAVAAKKDDPLASEYKKYISPRKIKAGYLVERHDGWYIRPALLIDDAPFVWVQDNKVCSTYPNFISVKNSTYCPQYISNVGFEDIYIKNTRSFAGRLSADPDTCKYRGVLVTSGNMSESGTDAKSTKRSNHCLVREENKKAELLKISDDAIQDYCSALTDFQQQPPFRSGKGILSNGRCVFYCQPQAGQMVSLFGQSPNFRIPYFSKDDGKAASALDFLPEGLLNSKAIDLTDAIFGFVRSEKQEDHSQQACASRVSISDAICQKLVSDDLWLKNKVFVPKTLGSPKPTTFQHYLVQSNADKPSLRSYASKPNVETVIRGHKLYWHKGRSPDIELGNPNDVSNTQKTLIRPIKPGVEFQFSIHFENLSHSELGVLLWILNIAQDEKYRLSLGMGKPLGMGAVKIEYQLHLSDRTKRYNTLFNKENVWETGYSNSVTSDEEANYIATFENFILQSLGTTGSFKELRRIKMLLAMLTWQENLSQAELDERRYMEIERDKDARHVIGRPKPGKNTVNEYADRPVLPTPLQVMGWDDDGDDDNNPNPGNSGRGNSPKPNPRNPRSSDRPKPKPSNSSSNQGGKTAMELALERAQKKPKRK